MIQKINKLAALYHEGQTRQDGVTPYITHPLDAQKRAENCGYDDFIILAALVLHDTIEDCGINPQTLVRDLLFQHLTPEEAVQIADTVVSLTNSDLFYDIKKQFNRKRRRKIREAHYKMASTRAKICKIFDCYSNINDMEGMEPDFAKLYKREVAELMEVIRDHLFDTDEIDVRPARKIATEIIETCRG